MKILLINNHYHISGGADRVFFNDAALLQKRGKEVICFSGKSPHNLQSPYERYFVSGFQYDNKAKAREKIISGINLLYSREAKNKLEELIKIVRPDIAHLHNFYHQISPSILHTLKRFNIPTVMSVHDYKLVCASYLLFRNNAICELCRNGKHYNCFLTKCVKNSRAKSLLSTLEMYLHHKALNVYSLVDVFTSPSSFAEKKIQDMGFKGKFVCLPHYIETEDFFEQISPSEDYIVYFGRLSREKGLLNLVKSMRSFENLKLKIIGDGPFGKEIREEIASLGLKNVLLLGWKEHDELKREIVNSLMTVLPSEWFENSPNSILESFALGKPVLASRIGGNPELVRDKETGFLFEPGNHEDLADKIRFLLNNRAMLVEMGRNARSLIEQHFNAEARYNGLMQLYDMVL